jgi:hypothetical protein
MTASSVLLNAVHMLMLRFTNILLHEAQRLAAPIEHSSKHPCTWCNLSLHVQHCSLRLHTTAAPHALQLLISAVVVCNGARRG